jgi:hypothetical protein
LLIFLFHGKPVLFPQGFLYLTDFLLHFPGNLLGNAFAFQVGIVRQFAHFFFDRALYFVNFACDFIPRAGLHFVGSLEEIRVPARGSLASLHCTVHVTKNKDGYLST